MSGAAVSYLAPSSGARVRWMLARLGMTQAAAAGELGIDEAELQAYCAGTPAPRAIVLALERLVDLRRMVTG